MGGKECKMQANLQLRARPGIWPEGEGQAALSFPDYLGRVDTTLALNSTYSFQSFFGQGKIYLKIDERVKSLTVFVNGRRVNPSDLRAGGVYEVDISPVARNGKSTLMIGNILPREIRNAVQVFIPYPVVLEGTPEETGISPTVLRVIESIIRKDIDHGFSAAQLAVIRNGRLVYSQAFGKIKTYEKDGTRVFGGADVTRDTLFDIASNTKMYTVNYALQYLVTRNQIDLDTRIVDMLGERFADDTLDLQIGNEKMPPVEKNREWKRKLTIRDILRHQGGFMDDPYYQAENFDQAAQKMVLGAVNPLYAGPADDPGTRENTLEMICRTPVIYEPGTKTMYSDVDYMILTYIIEQIVGKRLDVFLKETFFDPMDLKRITYNPLDHGYTRDQCAPTELKGNTRDGAIYFPGTRTETLQGQVHDEKAWYCMGGISGHAGIFTTAEQLASLASVMLTGGYANQMFFSRDVMDVFTAPKKEDAANWGLGWWRQADQKRPWYFGTRCSSSAFGHQGWTGTLTMIDPEENLVIAYLTNKIHSPVTNKELNPHSFNGSKYTAASLGFVAQILYMGLNADEAELQEMLSYLLCDMAAEADKLAEQNGDSDGPFTRSAEAKWEVFKEYIASRPDAEKEALLPLANFR